MKLIGASPFLAIFVSVVLSAGSLAAQDPEPYTPQLNQPGKDVQWVPTPPALVERMLDMARLGPKDLLVDLGSGDGVLVITRRKARRPRPWHRVRPPLGRVLEETRSRSRRRPSYQIRSRRRVQDRPFRRDGGVHFLVAIHESALAADLPGHEAGYAHRRQHLRHR
jgi:hypothetical protein